MVCDPRLSKVIEELEQGEVAPEERKRLAAKAFNHTAYYDSLIAQYLGQPQFPERMTVALVKKADLRYGENPTKGCVLSADAAGSSQHRCC